MNDNNQDVSYIMRRITTMINPSVYRVSVSKSDYSVFYTAYAVLRGNDEREYSANGDSVIDALLELEKVLRSLVCPTCGRVKDE